MSEVRVHLRHVRAQKWCVRSVREWFKLHRLSWDDFIANGIPAEQLRAMNDHYATVIADVAEQEAGVGR